jgi:SPP1 family predicted phage head-tail adaptor
MDTNELDRLRADLEADLLPDTCYILTKVRTSNGAGGWTTTTVTSDTVACRLDPLRGREAVVAGVQQPFHGYMLTLPNGTTITTDQKVEVNGVRYNVISMDADKSWAASVRALVERLG